MLGRRRGSRGAGSRRVEGKGKRKAVGKDEGCRRGLEHVSTVILTVGHSGYILVLEP